jgi:hypothetical protein
VSDYHPSLFVIIWWAVLGPPALIFVYRFWFSQYRRGWGLERKNGKSDLTFREAPIAYSFVTGVMIFGTIGFTYGSFLIVWAAVSGKISN